MELGYPGYGGLLYLGYCGPRISRIWWNYDIYDMVELRYLRYGGTRISIIIRWKYDIQDIVELGYLGYGGTRISRIWWNSGI